MFDREDEDPVRPEVVPGDIEKAVQVLDVVQGQARDRDVERLEALAAPGFQVLETDLAGRAEERAAGFVEHPAGCRRGPGSGPPVLQGVSPDPGVAASEV